MRDFIMRILAITIILMAMALTGAPQSIPLRIPDTTATQGSLIDIPIYADSTLTGKNILAYSLQLTYDPLLLQAVSVVTQGTILQQYGSPIVNTSTPGLLKIAGAGTSPLTGAGVLIIMRFNATTTGYGMISFNGNQFNYFNEGNPPVTFTPCQIAIIHAPSITVIPDQEIIITGDTLPFNVTGGTPPYQWFVTNPAVASINSSGTLTAISHGTTRVVTHDLNGLKDTTNGFIDIRPFALYIADTLSQYQGNIIDISVYATSLTGLGILSGSFSLQFNQGLMTPVGVLTNGTLISSFSSPVINTSVPGIVDLAFAGTTPLAGTGVLCVIRFMLSGTNTGSSSIVLNTPVFNQQLIPKTINGSVDVIPLPQLQIIPFSNTMVIGQIQQQQLTVTGGATPPLQWSVSNPSIASVSQSGLLTVTGSGVIHVTVTDSIGASGISNSITIYDTWVIAPDTSICATPQTFLYPVFIGSLQPAGKSVKSFEAKFSVLSSSAVITGISTNGTLTQGWMTAYNISGSEIMVASGSANGLNADGILFFLELETDSSFKQGDYITVMLNSLMLNEGSPTALTSPVSFIYGLNYDSLKVLIYSNPPGGVCSGEQVTYSAVYSGGSLINSYTWKVNGIQQGGNSSQFTSVVLQNNDVIECTVSSQASQCLLNNPATSDPLTAVIYPVPVITPINDDTVCNNSNIILTAVVSGGSGLFNYMWSNNATTPSISPVIIQDEQFQVIVTDTNNCSDTALINIFVSSPSVNLGDDDTICHGGSSILNTAVTGGFAPINYSWSTTGSGPSITVFPTSTQSYHITVTDIIGCNASDNITVLVSNPATTAGSNDTICFGASKTITSQTTGGIAPYNYSWQHGGNQAQTIVTPSSGQSYSVTVTDIAGCISSAMVYVEVSNPLTNAGSDDTICIMANTTLSASAAGGYTPYQYLWSNQATTQQITVGPVINTQYTVTLTDRFNCTATDQVNVLVSNPVTQLGADDTLCPGQQKTLTAATTGGLPPYSYNWSGAQTGLSINVTPSATTVYNVTVTDGQGCISGDNLTVFVSNPSGNAGPDQGACPGETVTFNGTVTGGYSPLTYTWNNNPGQQYQITATTNTTLVFKVTDKFGCISTDTALLTVFPNPVITPIPDDTVCYDAASTINATVTGGTGSISYLWNTSATASSINPTITQNSQFWVKVTDINNCSASDTMMVFVSNPFLTTGSDDTLCPGDTKLIAPQITGGFAPYSYNWSTGAVIPQITITGIVDTCISLTITDLIGCDAKDTVCIMVNQIIVDAGPDVSQCPNDPLNLSAAVTGGVGALSYQWSTGATTASLVAFPVTDSVFVITVNDAFGCYATDSMEVAMYPVPSPNLGTDDTMCINHIKTLDAGPGLSSYLWSTGASTQTIMLDGSLLGAGTFNFSVAVTNQFGCGNADTIIIVVDPCIGIGSDYNESDFLIFPNPASDYINIKSNIPGGYTVTILNSNGKIILIKHISNPDPVTERIEIKNLAHGLYFVYVTSTVGTVVRKLVIR